MHCLKVTIETLVNREGERNESETKVDLAVEETKARGEKGEKFPNKEQN